MRALLILTAAASAGCHVTVTTEVTHARPGRVALDRDRARALPPTIELRTDGKLRFVERLVCPGEAVVDVDPEVHRRTSPNLATFVVGIVATAAGAVAVFSGAVGDDPATSPITWGGVGMVAVGLPFAIGPWLGNGTSIELQPSRVERRGSPADAPCGERSTGATSALLSIGDRRVYGRVEPDGTFAVPVFTWIDAFAVDGAAAFAVRAELVHGTARSIEAVVEASAVAAARDAFTSAAGIDTRAPALTKVPQITVTAIEVNHATADADRLLRVGVRVENAGPGDAWRLRATIDSALPELDGRVIYIGHVPAKAGTGGQLWIPLAPDTYNRVVGAPLALTVRLADAHGTVSDLPVPWRGVPSAGMPIDI